GAVEDAQAAFAVQGEKALAALFGKNLRDGAGAKLEIAYVLQFGLAIGAAHHEPLADAPVGVAHQQRDAAQQGADLGDLARAVQQLVAAVQLLAAQVEDIGAGAAAERVEPLVARIEQHLADRLAQLRKLQAVLLDAGLAGHQVFRRSDTQRVQRGSGGDGDQQVAAVAADRRMLDGAALRVQLQWRLTERVIDLRGNGPLVVRIADLVVVLQHQRLPVI